MNTLVLILAILEVILALFLIGTIIFQSGKSERLGSITGAADSLIGNKTKSTAWDERLSKITVFVSIAFLLNAVILSLLS